MLPPRCIVVLLQNLRMLVVYISITVVTVQPHPQDVTIVWLKHCGISVKGCSLKELADLFETDICFYYQYYSTVNYR